MKEGADFHHGEGGGEFERSSIIKVTENDIPLFPSNLKDRELDRDYIIKNITQK